MDQPSPGPYASIPRPVPPEPLAPQTVASPGAGQVVEPAYGYGAPDLTGTIRVLGTCYVVLGVLAGLVIVGAAFWFAFIFHSANATDHSTPPPPPGSYAFGLLVLLVGVLVGSVLPLVTGWGLLSRKTWARTLAIVNSFLILLSFPFGTTLGGFALYFLMRAGGQQSWEQYASGRM